MGLRHRWQLYRSRASFRPRRRRGGAGSMRIRPPIRLTSAPARVCFSLGSGCAAAVSRAARSNAASKASTLPSSAGPSWPNRSIARSNSRSADFLRHGGKSLAVEDFEPNALASRDVRSRDPSARDSARRHRPEPPPRRWPGPAARPAAPDCAHRRPRPPAPASTPAAAAA